MIKITIPLRLPGLNEYVDVCRKNRFQAANFKKQVENDCLMFIRAGLRGRTFTQIGITFVWYEKDKRRDKDNIAFAKKFILDQMQTMQIISGDGWRQIAFLQDEFRVDRQNPGVEIHLYIIEE